MTAPLLPDLSPGNLDRNSDLADRIDALPIEDAIRVLVTAAHSVWHRAPKRLSHDELVAELRAGIDDLHAAGLP